MQLLQAFAKRFRGNACQQRRPDPGGLGVLGGTRLLREGLGVRILRVTAARRRIAVISASS